jgi:crotonobetainyl-CoA:carnitine CoA-transferase CaiB-like acyl-CoA transferase
MVGHPEWTEDRSLFLDRARLAPTIDAWFADQNATDVLDLASAFRIPNAPIVNGANATTYDHFRERATFVANATDGAANPRPPYRLSSTQLREPQPAPRLGEHSANAGWERRDAAIAPSRELPFSGLRVLDMTAYWAGPLVGHVLALLGAEVIHLESTKRPDGARLVGGVPDTEDCFWERGPIFAALNTNKKSVTVDIANEHGVDLVKRLVASCDVVVENFTPRVLDQLGLTYEALKSARPDLVMVRMPGFGLDGPWRDNAAFAFVIEDASGLTWLTGFPDGLPIEPYCVGDPNAGLHALFGLMVALEHRDQTGEGCLVEASMVDAALNVAAEQVIEHSAYGALLSRQGNRGPCAAPQNLYHAAAADRFDDSWVAIAVATDAQWVALQRALGDPEWAADPMLATVAGRVADQDRIDADLGAWCRERSVDEIVECLWDAGVPVGAVTQPQHQPELPQLIARNFFEELEHPVAPASRYSTLPMRMSESPQRLHVRHAPLLGEHNAEVLGGLGLSTSDLDRLETDGIIGRSVTMATGAN